MWCAKGYRNSKVFAVDLSRASIAYAMMKASEYGVDNVTFRQGDILKLPSLNRQFDIVEAVGVLHHMDDPAAGMDALNKCLKPGGWMKVGLYSLAAHRVINIAREQIKAKNYQATAPDIRRFRREIMLDTESDLYEICATWRAFDSLSECRDMLFHVQMHQFTIPKLKRLIGRFGLQFVGFRQNFAEITAKAPEISDWESMDQWNAFEQSHPMTFKNMYVMWLRKPLGPS